MKQVQTLLFIVGVMISTNIIAQNTPVIIAENQLPTASNIPPLAENASDKILRDKVLNEIQSGFDKKTKSIDSTVTKLDKKVTDLDISIKESKDAKEKVDKLLQRVQALEDRQKAVEQNELNAYQANYQSAIVNLVSMEREIKPLLLFNSARDFFTKLNEAGNPMNYSGYKDWFEGFNKYVKKNEEHSSVLTISSNLLTFSGNTSQYVPVVGPISSVLFASMSTYVGGMGKKEKALREQSEKMIALTMKISQFDYDKGNVEHEWELITAELSDLQKLYTHCLDHNLKILSIQNAAFSDSFTTQSDAEKRYQYLTTMRQKASDYIASKKSADPKNWKENVYYEMMEVQSLKTRFGQITFRISENILKYGDVFSKYRADAQIGSQVTSLQSRLTDLKQTFDKAFDPMDYINSATRMYKVI